MIAVDIIIIILLGVGLFEGYKSGLINSLLRLVGSVLVFVLSYALKGPLSIFLMEKMPTLNFSGVFTGISSLNVMVYEAIAFIILSVVFGIVLNILIRLSGVFNKILNSSFITGIPNKILGAALGFVRLYIFVFIVVFVLSLIPQTTKTIKDSYLPPIILKQTPILSSMTKDFTKSFDEINKLFDNLNKESEEANLNGETLEILLKYNIVTKDTAIKLHEAGKLDIENFDEIIKNY